MSGAVDKDADLAWCRCGGIASGECSQCGRDLVAYDLPHIDTGDDLICEDCATRPTGSDR